MREKLLYIRKILIQADQQQLKLPEDIVSRLLEQSFPMIRWLAETDGQNFLVYLNFILNLKIENKYLKKQMMLEILNQTRWDCTDIQSEQFSTYLDSIVKFSELEPTKKQLFSYIRMGKDKRKNTLSLFKNIISLLLKEEFTHREIYSLLQSTIENPKLTDEEVFNSLREIGTIIISGFTKDWIENKEISHEEFYQYLLWSRERKEISALLSNRDFCTLDISKLEFHQLLTKIKKQNDPSLLDIETELLMNPDFHALVEQAVIHIPNFLSFVKKAETSENKLALVIFSYFLVPFHLYFTKNGEFSVYALSHDLASTITDEKKDSLLNLLNSNNNYFFRLLISEEELRIGQDALIQLLNYFETLDPASLDSVAEILQQKKLQKTLNSFSELIDFIEKFTQLDPSLTKEFQKSITNENIKRLSQTNPDIYQIYPYLLNKLSPSITKEKEKQIRAAFTALNCGEFLENSATNNALEIYKKIIDLIFKTKYDWERKNILDALTEQYPSDISLDTYLIAIDYMKELKQRPKKEFIEFQKKSQKESQVSVIESSLSPTYRLYQAQIDEVDHMLKQEKVKRNKVLKK